MVHVNVGIFTFKMISIEVMRHKFEFEVLLIAVKMSVAFKSHNIVADILVIKTD